MVCSYSREEVTCARTNVKKARLRFVILKEENRKNRVRQMPYAIFYVIKLLCVYVVAEADKAFFAFFGSLVNAGVLKDLHKDLTHLVA